MAERATGWVDRNRRCWDTEEEADTSNATLDFDAWALDHSDTVEELFGHDFTDERVIRVSDLRGHAAAFLPILAAYVKAQASDG